MSILITVYSFDATSCKPISISFYVMNRDQPGQINFNDLALQDLLIFSGLIESY